MLYVINNGQTHNLLLDIIPISDAGIVHELWESQRRCPLTDESNIPLPTNCSTRYHLHPASQLKCTERSGQHKIHLQKYVLSETSFADPQRNIPVM